MMQSRLSLLLAGSLALTGLASAQTAPPPQSTTPRNIDSGFLNNPGAKELVVFQTRLQAAGAPWMQFHFAKHSSLPTGSFLRLTASRDAGMQRLDGNSIVEWSHQSAYFNGDDVLLELVAGAGTQGNRIIVSALTEGLQVVAPESICGNTDDRVLSSDPRQGRLAMGCTGWMINTDVMLTAGHCTGASTRIYEMNVPLSSSSGSVVRSAPNDQYPYTELQAVASGIGADWGVCRVGRNSNTGLLPTEANGGQWYNLGAIPGSTSGQTIRITGYGTTSPRNSWSQVQKTHTGGLAQIGATSLCYTPDTTGGNSGSPVIHENTGNAIGIHTHGGCTSTGGCNSGTRIDRSDLQQAIAAANPNGAQFIAYGLGCPTPPNFYQQFTSSNNAGSAYLLTPNAAGGWNISACSSGCLVSNFGSNLGLGDDQLATNQALGFSFPLPGTGTSTTAIDIDSNGWIGLIAGQHTGSDFSESVAELLSDPARLAVWWDDLNPASGGSVHFTTAPGVAVVTWSGVPEFGATNSNTYQAQFRANGSIVLYYDSGNTSADGIVGYSVGGGTTDPGSIDISGSLPFSTGGGGSPLTLSAQALPVIGQTASLRLANLPASSIAAVLNIGLSRRSTGLDFLGMSGCRLYTDIASSGGMQRSGSTATINLPIPNNNALLGLSVYGQGVVLAPGVNNAGAISSNGGELRIGN